MTANKAKRKAAVKRTKEWKKSHPDKDRQHRKNYKKNHRDEINASQRSWRAANPEKMRGYRQKYYDPEEAFERNKQWRDANPEGMWRAHLKAHYSITADEYNQIFTQQEGRCAICGIHQSELNKRLGVDHDHETGDIRGLLCHKCNVGIGHFMDNPDLVAVALKYLQKHRN